MRASRHLGAAAVLVVLVACGERVQTIPVGTAKKVDAQVWQTKDARFLAPGWTPGDEASWNAQMAHRAQGQNDYAPRK
ncbi:MAG: hypothetical protein ABI520_03225 [Caldimonas sp.]